MSEVTLDFTGAWLDFRFIQLRESVGVCERLIEDPAAAYEARLAADAERLPPEAREQFYAQTTEEYWKHRERFPNLVRRAVFLVCHTEIEAYLNGLCRAAQKKLGLSGTVHDLPGGGIDRAKRYLKKVAKQPFPSDTREWNAMKD